MKLLAVMLALAPAPAAAADWWWVEGEPQDAAMTFVDSASAARQGETVTLRTATVDRSGQMIERTLRFSCAGQPREGAHRFAGAGDADRMTWAAMLGGLTPREAAMAIFASGERETPRRIRRPAMGAELGRVARV
jgi:hypothetical protein